MQNYKLVVDPNIILKSKIFFLIYLVRPEILTSIKGGYIPKLNKKLKEFEVRLRH